MIIYTSIDIDFFHSVCNFLNLSIVLMDFFYLVRNLARYSHYLYNIFLGSYFGI